MERNILGAFVVPGVLCPCPSLSPAFVLPTIHPPWRSLAWLFVVTVCCQGCTCGSSSLHSSSSPFVILAVCHPPFMAIIIISTSNSPYKQWLVDRLVVLVMWQWWQQMLAWLLWGLLEVAIAEYEQNPLLPCK